MTHYQPARDDGRCGYVLSDILAASACLAPKGHHDNIHEPKQETTLELLDGVWRSVHGIHSRRYSLGRDCNYPVCVEIQRLSDALQADADKLIALTGLLERASMIVDKVRRRWPTTDLNLAAFDAWLADYESVKEKP